MFDAKQYLITVVELSPFRKGIEGILTAEEVEGLITYVAGHPDAGKVIPDTGGLRKLRWAAQGKGKSGGARIIYYFRDLNMPLYLLTVFGKGEKIDLTMAEKRSMRKIVDQIVSEHWKIGVTSRIVALSRA